MEKIYTCEPDFLQSWQEKIINATEEQYKSAFSLFGEKKKDDIYSINGDTININISGPLSNSGPGFLEMLFGIGGTGYNDILEALELADDDSIKNINLHMNTPGGEVGRVQEVYNKLSRMSGKNITAINHGMIASAGYWIASAANKIFSTSSPNMTGSIGVVIMAVDDSEMYKQSGAKKVVITSKNAKNKIPDLAKKEGKSLLQERVDAIENIFISDVAKGRGINTEKVISDFGQGKVFVSKNPDGEDAIKIGMIDGMIKASSKDDNNKPAANAGAKQTEVKAMNLKELMASDPAIKAEVESLIAEKYNAGLAEGKKEITARIDAVKSYIGSEVYPKSVQELAVKVITGEIQKDSFIVGVTMFDAKIEKEKSDAAKNHEKNEGNIPGQLNWTISANGEIKTADDISLESKRLKKLAEGR